MEIIKGRKELVKFRYTLEDKKQYKQIKANNLLNKHN